MINIFITKMSKSLSTKPIVWILVIAFLVRLAAAVYLGNNLSGLSGAYDEISYNTLAERYVEGYGLTFPSDWYPWIKANAPQSYYSIIMSLYLVGIYRIFGYLPIVARLITVLLSTISVYVIFLLVRKVFNQKVALFAALISALYAYLIFYGVTLVTETPFILFILLSIYLAYDISEFPKMWKWIGLGIALSICVLFRMAVIFYIPFLLTWIIWKQRSNRLYAIIPLVLIFVSILPFTIRNYQIWGRFLLLESQFGHVFWNGNHPDSNGDFHPYRVFPIPGEVLSENNDVVITNRLLKMGIENIGNNPNLFISLIITRLREFFKFWPTSDSDTVANFMRVISFGVLLPLSVMGLWLSRKEFWRLTPIWLFMLIHTGVYAISWTMIRYRIPLDAILTMFAGLTVADLACRFQSRRNAL